MNTKRTIAQAIGGYTIGHTDIGGWYALLPGETEFRHVDGAHNYVGFFDSEEELLDELCPRNRVTFNGPDAVNKVVEFARKVGVPENTDPPPLVLMPADELANLRRQGRWLLGFTYNRKSSQWADQLFGTIEEFREYTLSCGYDTMFCHQLSNRS